MWIFLDCEYNDFQGELISMALVSEEGHEWYEVVPCLYPTPWVAEHVMPILHKAPVRYQEMQSSLWRWLAQFPSVHIIADWPEDIVHFCRALITGPGTRIDTPPISFDIRRIDSESALPHNALWDARGLKNAVLFGEPPAIPEPTPENDPEYYDKVRAFVEAD